MIDALDIRLIQKLAVVVKKLLRARKVPIPEDGHKPELPQNGQQILYHSCAAEPAGRDAADPHRLMDVFLQVRIQHVLEQARVAVVVLRRHDHQRIRTGHGRGELRILDRFAGVAGRERDISNVDQLGLDPVPFPNLFQYKPGDPFARAALADRAENDWNKNWPVSIHQPSSSSALSYLSTICITWPSGSRTRKPLANPSSLPLRSATPEETRLYFTPINLCAGLSALPMIRLVCQ